MTSISKHYIEDPPEDDAVNRIGEGNWYCLMCQRDLFHACPLHGPRAKISRRKSGPGCNHCGNELRAPQTIRRRQCHRCHPLAYRWDIGWAA
jgi:hypothetical protein